MKTTQSSSTMIVESGSRPPELFRIHIRPKGGLGVSSASFEYCLRENVLGLGWSVEFPQHSDHSWKAYESLGEQEYGAHGLTRVRYLHDKLRPNDLIWTRDACGLYYLAKVLTPWEYYDGPGSADADVVNVVRCRILPVEQVDDASGEIINCFRPTRAIQAIRKSTAINYSKLLWNHLSSSNDYEAPRGRLRDLFSFLDCETVEDVVFIYLQKLGWLVIPNSRKADTMSYEFIFIHGESKKRGVVQVKTGESSIDREQLKPPNCEVFLFQTNGIYSGANGSQVTCLDPETLRIFITENLDIMPATVQHWVAHLRGNGEM